MIVFIVTIAHLGNHYIDSIWSQDKHAASRVEELTRELQRCGYRVGKGELFHVWLGERSILDAAVETPHWTEKVK